MNGDHVPSDEETVEAIRGYFDQEIDEARSRLAMPRRPVREPAAHALPKRVASLAGILIVLALLAAAWRISSLPGGTVGPAAAESTASSEAAASVQSEPGPITFSPSTISCSNPPDWTLTVRLPSSVQYGQTLTVTVDGYWTGEPDGAWDYLVRQSDGSWSATFTIDAASIRTSCALGGVIGGGVPMYVPGTHDMRVLDPSGRVVAEGTYTAVP